MEMEQFEIIKDYRENEILRNSFNELATETFGLSFNKWYENGYWTDKYNPYSMVINNKVVANVSVNKMEFAVDGRILKYIQVGTVMTDKKYRNRGFIKKLMQEVDKDYYDIVDGIYLFANDSALGLYSKLGYKICDEYQYSKVKSNEIIDNQVKKIQMCDKNNWILLEEAIDKCVNNSAFEMVNNKELIMFYATQFMESNVYYVENEEAYIIAEINGDEMVLHNIFSEKLVNIDRIVGAFGRNINKVILGFMPLSNKGYEVHKVLEDDTTLFFKGKGFDLFKGNKCIFPTLSHA